MEIIAPTPRGVWKEALAVREVPRLAGFAPMLLRVPRGSNEPVISIPGASSSDRATAPLRRYLRRIGYTALPWGFGVNDADVEKWLPLVTKLVAETADQHASKVALTGWSNGGILAREIARDRPDLVKHVFTYGTPLIGGPRYTLGGSMYTAHELDRLDALIAERNQVSLQVPVTAFWSKRDAIVAWRSCVDTWTPGVENIEVRSTHMGMTIDPAIWRAIAVRLARGPSTSPVT